MPSASASASGSAGLQAVASSGVAAPPGSGGAVGRVPACSLITKAEMESVLHDTFQEPSESRHVAGICEFTHPGSHLASIGITLLPYTTRSQFESETARAADMIKGKREPVAGVGEEAFEIERSMLTVYAHGKAFELTYLFKPLPPPERDALAKIALGRL